MKQYVILGAGDSVICMLFEMLHQLSNKQINIPIIKNVPSPSVRLPYETSLIKGVEMESDNWKPNSLDQYLLGVVNPTIKKRVLDYFFENFSINDSHFPVLNASSENTASTVKLDYGVVINPNCIVAGHTNISKHAFINRSVSIGHHSVIGACASVNPGVTICGSCKIGDYSTIGAGTTILNNVSVGNNSVIGAGSVVTRDIPDNVVAYGSPAKIIRKVS